MKNNISNLKNTVLGTTKQFYLAGLGVAVTVGDRSKNVFDQLVEKGQGASSKDPVVKTAGLAGGFTNRFKNVSDKAGERLQETVAGTFNRFGIPTREQMQALTRTVENLTEKVNSLQTGESA